MVPPDTDEDNQGGPEEYALKHLKKEITPSQPNQSLATPQSRLSYILPDKSCSAPKSFDPSAPYLDVPSSMSTSMSLPTRSRKRDSNGEIKQMVAELSARADLAISRKKTATPESWKFGHDLPSPGQRANDRKWEVFRKYPSIMSYSPRSPKTPRDTFPMEGGSKDVEEELGQKDNPGKRKRQGSLLEWRNKEMFEEPVRI